MDSTNDPARVEDAPERDGRDPRPVEPPRERDHELAEARERRGARTSAAPDRDAADRKDRAAPRHDLPAGTRRGTSTSNPGDRQMESGRTTASPEERAQPRAAHPPAP